MRSLCLCQNGKTVTNPYQGSTLYSYPVRLVGFPDPVTKETVLLPRAQFYNSIMVDKL